MTPAALRLARQQLGLSQAGLAALLNVSSARTIRKWEHGERDIPGPAVVLLELLLGSSEARAAMGLRVATAPQG